MMNFIASFFGTCCGTEVFRTLRQHSVGRVLRHLLLMVILCAVCIGGGSYYSLKYRWRSAEAAFNAGFGTQLYFDKKGVHPALDPQLSRRQEFPYNGLLIYVSPDGREKDYPDITLFDRNFILLWHPACFALAVREGNAWIFGRYNAGGKIEMVVTPLSFSGMKEHLLAAAELPASDKWQWESETLSSRTLFKDFRMAYSNAKAIEYFLREMFMVLAGTLFFAAFFRLCSCRKFPQLTFATVWKVAVYAAFPVLLVVSMFPALLLPGMGYFNELFVLGWAVYLFFVLRSLILAPEEPEEKKGEKENE